MNAAKAVSTGILLLGLGFSNVQPVNAKIAEEAKEQIRSLPTELPTEKLPTKQTNSYQHSETRIAQSTSRSNSPMYGTWKLTYSTNGVVYESVLIMKGHTGGLGVKYYDSSLGRTRVISQQIRLRSSSQGLILVGSNPMDYHTKRFVRNYSPDNFLFSIRPNGSFVAITCDRARRCSNVEVRRIK